MRREHEFDLDEVNIGGDAELEARYREWLPVVEIDGERAFVYHLDAGRVPPEAGRTKSDCLSGPTQGTEAGWHNGARCYKQRHKEWL